MNETMICRHEESDEETGQPVFTIIFSREQHRMLTEIMAELALSREDAIREVLDAGFDVV